MWTGPRSVPERQGSLSRMAPVQAQQLINARSSTVWDIITDSGNFEVWNSGITSVTGVIRNGGTIRIRTPHGGGRSFRLRVEQVPGQIMTWTHIAAPGLGATVRTFVLTRRDRMTLLVVSDDTKGPLPGIIGSPFRGQDLEAFVNSVRDRAELIG